MRLRLLDLFAGIGGFRYYPFHYAKIVWEMSRSVALCALLVMLGSVVWVAAAAPHWLDDRNDFLKAFVNHELLGVLGVILAITLASASQIHLKFNDLEERAERDFLQRSRQELKRDAYGLILSFLIAIVVVLVKPLFVHHQFGVAFINGFAIWILLFDLLILLDLTVGIFSIPPYRKR